VERLVRLVLVGAIVSLWLVGHTIRAQEAAAPAVSALTDLDRALITSVQLASRLADWQCSLVRAWISTDAVGQSLGQTTCQALQSYRQYVALKTEATTKIEANHPGQTIDWTTFVLVPKAAPAKAP
jgi:hypothetical protein